MKLFFAVNYSTYGLVWLMQLVTVYLFGLESFGEYVVFLSIMAFVEAPLIAGRSDSALNGLNSTSNRSAFLQLAMRRDAISAVIISPFIFAIVSLSIGWLEAALALLVIFAQSGYAAAKNYYVAKKLRQEFALIEFASALIQLMLLIVASFLGTSVQILIFVYLLNSALKNIILFIVIFSMYESASQAQDRETKLNGYQPLGPVLTGRNLLLNSFNNLDILILAGKTGPENIAIYKIVKTVAGIMFRIVAPLWRWDLYSLNERGHKKRSKAYYQRHLRGAFVALISLMSALVCFAVGGNKIIGQLYDVDISIFDLPWLLIVAASFAANWYLAWYKIDMLFEPRKIVTLVWPLVYVLGILCLGLVDADPFMFASNAALFTLFFVVLASLILLNPGREKNS